MKVRAVQLGYYGHQRRKIGAEFPIKSLEEFSHVWMEPVDFEAPAKPKREAPLDAVRAAKSLAKLSAAELYALGFERSAPKAAQESEPAEADEPKAEAPKGKRGKAKDQAA